MLSDGFRLHSIAVDEPNDLEFRHMPASQSHRVGAQCLKLTDPGAFSNGDSVTSVIIGANGSGKSRLLREIADSFRNLSDYCSGTKSGVSATGCHVKYELRRAQYSAEIASQRSIKIARNGRLVVEEVARIDLPARVIALTTTPFDKFALPGRGGMLDPSLPFRNDGVYRYLGLRDRSGRASTVALFYRLVENLAAADSQGHRPTKIQTVFELLGYEATIDIGYRFRGAGTDRKTDIRTALNFIETGKTDKTIGFDSVARRLGELVPLVGADRLSFLVHDVLRLAERGSFSISFNLASDRATDYFALIVVLHNLRVYLHCSLESFVLRRKRDHLAIDLRRGSSGEIGLMVTFIALASAIEDRSLVLIDEPEISLHPEWQTRYLDLLSSAFASYRGCHFILATHSPLIISDIGRENATVSSLDDDDVAPIEELSGKSSDSLLVNAFGIVGNDNLYVKQQILHALRLLSDGEAKSERFKSTIEPLARARVRLATDDPIAQIIDELIESSGLSQKS